MDPSSGTQREINYCSQQLHTRVCYLYYSFLLRFNIWTVFANARYCVSIGEETRPQQNHNCVNRDALRIITLEKSNLCTEPLFLSRPVGANMMSFAYIKVSILNNIPNAWIWKRSNRFDPHTGGRASKSYLRIFFLVGAFHRAGIRNGRKTLGLRTCMP